MYKKIIVIMISLFLWGCSSGIELQKQSFTIELGKDVYANPTLYVKDNINLDGAKVVCNSIGVDKKNNRFMTSGKDYLVVGEYDFVIEYKNKEYPFVIKVKDTKAPVCQSGSDDFTVKKGATVNWDDYFHASDLSGVSYDGTVDTSTTGEKDVKVVISDRFKNSVTKTVHVVVES